MKMKIKNTLKLNYNKNVNELISQATRNLDEMFSLCKTVQKQVNTLSQMVIDETADTSKKVAKELVAAGDEISGETLRLVQGCFDDSIKTIFTEEKKREIKKAVKSEAKEVKKVVKAEVKEAKKVLKSVASEVKEIKKAV